MLQLFIVELPLSVALRCAKTRAVRGRRVAELAQFAKRAAAPKNCAVHLTKTHADTCEVELSSIAEPRISIPL